MMIARLTDGRWIVGIEERNVELLRQGKPMIIKFSEIDANVEDACVIYGKTLEDVRAQIQDRITEETIVIDNRGTLQ